MNANIRELFADCDRSDSSEDNVKKRRVRLVANDDNPFDTCYYPKLPFYYDRVVYKPGFMRYEADEAMDAYFYLGANLAIAGRDAPASTWIKAHRNDTD
jgi:hypothetical protein